MRFHPVGTKKVNELGIYDMSGNVMEWVSDWYGNYSGGSRTNPQGSSSGLARVYLGGSWPSPGLVATVSSRYNSAPDNRFVNGSIRLARSSK